VRAELARHLLPISTNFDQDGIMPAQEITLMVPAPDTSGAAPKPAADGAREAFLALLGPGLGSVAASQVGNLHAAAWRDLAQGWFHAADNAAVDRPTAEPRSRVNARSDDRRHESESVDDDPVPLDRQVASPPAREPRPRDADDGHDDGPATATRTLPESVPNAADQPVMAAPLVASGPAVLQGFAEAVLPNARAGTAPETPAIPAAPISMRPAGLGSAANEPVPLAADTANKTPAPPATLRDLASADTGDQVKTATTPGKLQITVTRDAERLVSRPAPAFTPDSQATTLSAQAGTGRVNTNAGDSRRQSGNTPSSPDTGTAAGRPNAATQPTANPGQAQAAVAKLTYLNSAGGGPTVNGGALRPASGTQGATTGPGPASGMTGQLARFEAAGGTAAPRSLAPGAKPVIQQIAVNIAKAIQGGTDRIIIQLKPAALGRVEVRLEVTADGRVQAVVTADRPETLEALQRDARGLERALQDAGLRTDSNSLSFNLRGGQNPNDGAPSSAGQDADSAAEDSLGDASVENEVAAAIGADMAADRGIDIHV
jgi:flagellar hook-length control protein FliK